MNYAEQIVESFRSSPVERILVVDDAYDPPEVQEEMAGDLIDVLESPDLRDHLGEEILAEQDRVAALESLEANEFDDEAVTTAMSSLYSAYVDTREAELDPGDRFADLKGSTLEALDPLVELLGRCGEAARIRKVGKLNALAEYKKLKPHMIFMDFFLSPPERAARAISKDQADADRARSISLLKRILRDNAEATPAVVLMSSETVRNRAPAYRSSLKGRVTALRFGFLDKKWIGGAGDHLNASGEAADVLIDTSGSFEFGQTLEVALLQWKKGAQAGLDKLYEELRDFDLKDFAYLLRFRLYEEGEPFADYLEWFLGESLRAIVDNEVEWNTEEFSRLNEPKLTEAIEGAHPAPSDRIARFFHRLRINSRVSRGRDRLALGDLYVAANNRNVRMVITPDCDLVPRDGRRVIRVLTVGGMIRGLEDEQALAGELIFHKPPKAIKWKVKDLMTHKLTDISSLDVDGASYSYRGTMRPLSAQTIQKVVLADLSRVGLAVPPAVDVSAPVKVYVTKRVDNHPHEEELKDLSDLRAQVFMPRGGKETQKRALFTQKFARELVATLGEIDEGALANEHRQHRRDCIEQVAELRKAMLQKGLDLPGKGIFGIGVLSGSQTRKHWLNIVIDVSDDALIHAQGTDPLAQ